MPAAAYVLSSFFMYKRGGPLRFRLPVSSFSSASPANKKLQASSSNRIRFDSMGNEIGPYEALAFLRAEVEGRITEEAGRGLVTLEGDCQVFEQHPSQLPSCFFLRKPPLSKGFWKPDCLLAIRRDGPCSMVSPLLPDYIGMKTFLDFHLPDGTKTDWVMVEYRLIDNGFVVDDLVLCKVLQLKQGPAPSGDAAAPLPNQVPLHPTMSSSSPRPEISFDVDELLNDIDFNDLDVGGPFTEYTHLSIEDYAAQGFIVGASWGPAIPPSSGREGQHWENKEPLVPNEVQLMRKRSRSSGNGKSEVWNYFTRIRTKDPEVVYAACHYCDRMFKAHPKKDGTSHLRRHTEKCPCKMHLHQPS